MDDFLAELNERREELEGEVFEMLYTLSGDGSCLGLTGKTRPSKCPNFYTTMISGEVEFMPKKCNFFQTLKGPPPSADLRYGEEDIISPSTFIFATIKG